MPSLTPLIVPLEEAQDRLPDLVAAAEGGAEVVLTRDGRPVARLIPYAAPPVGRKFGAMKGRARVDDAFFEPLPPEEMKYWE